MHTHRTPPRRTVRRYALRTLALLALIAVLSLAGLAHAKLIPYVEPLDGDWGDFDHYPVMTLEGSYLSGAFGRLGTPGDADVLHMRFDTVPDGPVSVELLVPVCSDHFTDFYPTLAVISPDHPMDEETLAALPFTLPEGLGAEILEPERPAEGDDGPRVPASDWNLWDQMYYEPLTITFELTAPAKYFFAVWDDTGGTGAYLLYTGADHPDSEVLDPQVLEDTFALISSGAWLGVDCDTPVDADTDAADADAAPDA